MSVHWNCGRENTSFSLSNCSVAMVETTVCFSRAAPPSHRRILIPRRYYIWLGNNGPQIPLPPFPSCGKLDIPLALSSGGVKDGKYLVCLGELSGLISLLAVKELLHTPSKQTHSPMNGRWLRGEVVHWKDGCNEWVEFIAYGCVAVFSIMTNQLRSLVLRFQPLREMKERRYGLGDVLLGLASEEFETYRCCWRMDMSR
ncbi:hypothetical protein B0J11DRAFT_16539 [Dendryphion nanum]|uniref:Uncharacterized protein n=1 Tax=Dendryphion nanum TaxID=256645 RepID=A0A9P9J203_9PLEO|nr:hypothetical protein B0J11DRAFT_16539 [Dendryphion nanum]